MLKFLVITPMVSDRPVATVVAGIQQLKIQGRTYRLLAQITIVLSASSLLSIM